MEKTIHLIEPINQSTNQSVKVVNIFILKTHYKIYV